VKKKTQDALSKLCQDEINILSEVDKLEKKFDNILMNFNEFDRDLQKDIKSWQPEINKLDDKNSDVLTNKIRNEANTLKNFLSKLRRVN
jgi:peptidoglycan hydrolase CwlO-like protein